MKVMVKAIVIGAHGTVTKILVQGLEDLEIKWTSGDPPNYGIIEIGQNTEKSPVDFRRLAVTQTPVENYQLTLVLKKLNHNQPSANVSVKNSQKSKICWLVGWLVNRGRNRSALWPIREINK